MRLLRSTVRLAAATVLVGAAGLALPASPASAATCSGSTGVSVVVDFHELGGGVQSACVAGGGGDTAASLFGAAGFPLTYVQRQAGFVCRVSGQPADNPCVSTPPTDAYWGLWWSDGTSGQWTYATRGATSQTVPDGGYVAFSWNGSTSRSAPGLAPAAHPTQASTPTTSATAGSSHSPKPSTSSKPGKTPKPSHATKPTIPAGSSASTTSASATPSDAPSASGSDTPSASATEKPSEASSTSAPATAGAGTTSTPEPSDDTAPASSEPIATADDDGLPAWVGPVVVAVLFAAGAAVAVVRRRQKPS